MSEHTPQHPDPARPHDPAPARTDPTQTDLIAGDPPVPITVWRTARTDADTGRAIGTRLAYRLVAAYSRPGDTVIDCTDGHLLAGACAAGRRQHHPGWFTEAPHLLIGPATRPAPDPSAANDGDLPDMTAWFGDDLTDLPDTDDHHTPPTTGLVVASWPLDEQEPANRVRLAVLLATCARLLRPGGCLVLVVTVPAGTVTTPPDLSPLAAAAGKAGLGYLQHIVAVTADTGADTFVYHATDEELLTLTEQRSGQPWTHRHHRVHVDLLVFSPPTAAPQRHRADGGDRRG
ncbi:hypothetical protein [Micromonospora sp. NPDC050495]|uniref:hypothetical protein n=1 Tax=Micromonospora sp. NPDC050495 TaxID=3154936 RepID=UPI003408D9C5